MCTGALADARRLLSGAPCREAQGDTAVPRTMRDALEHQQKLQRPKSAAMEDPPACPAMQLPDRNFTPAGETQQVTAPPRAEQAR